MCLHDSPRNLRIDPGPGQFGPGPGRPPFQLGDGGELATSLTRAKAYELRLGRFWKRVPRGELRKVLGQIALLPEGLPIKDVERRLAAALGDGVHPARVADVIALVRQAGGWVITKEPASKHLTYPKEWLRDPARAEAELDEAATLVMGPFHPVDRDVLFALLRE